MVNKNSSTKQKLLEILRNNTEPVSGEQIAEISGLSRVSVWKAVKSLEDAGYKIESTRKGYVLQEDRENSIFPWEFGSEEENILYYSETESTMNQARNIALTHNFKDGEIKIVTTDLQTNGIGIRQTQWKSTKGSLAFTVVMKPFCFPEEVKEITLIAKQTLISVLEKNSGRKFHMEDSAAKNGIYSEKGKVSGILEEYMVSGNVVQYLNLGIGLNLFEKQDCEDSDCVFEDSGNTINFRKQILSGFLIGFKTGVKKWKEKRESV